MYPTHAQAPGLSIDALSGICGSISIACWIVVFSPQIIENFRRGSADGLSVVFLVTWLIGDVFNIVGAILQGVLPTMIILAIYYTLADMVLLSQCFWYKGFHLTDHIEDTQKENGSAIENGETANERTNLLSNPENRSNGHDVQHDIANHLGIHHRTGSGSSSFRDRYLSIDATHLSITVPLTPSRKPSSTQPLPNSTLKSASLNLTLILLVCASGVLGWYLSSRNPTPPESSDAVEFNTAGQVLGYISAALYLGSRIPQLLLNHRRKSTEGISMLFFLFACIGNLTYVLSIFAYSPESACHIPRRCGTGEAGALYGKYILVNLSWLFGSAGTMMLDLGVFVQYFLYRKDEGSAGDGNFDHAVVDDGDEMPVGRARSRKRSVGLEVGHGNGNGN